MRIAIASGKGGASVWDRPFIAVDTDVEAPNLHLFLPPAVEASETVGLEVPILDPERCTLCGACRAICRYKAIAQFASRLTIFTDMCHGCGGCFAVCPSQALTPGSRELGVLDQGTVLEGRGRFLMGRSRIGEAMIPPLLRALRKKLDLMLTAIPADALIDSPPGVSCPAMTVGLDADAVLLVAEPTPFGFHDFRLAHQAFRQIGKPVAVIMNRAAMPGNAEGDGALRAYCAEQGLRVLGELPFDRAAAETYAKGRLIAATSPEWRVRFESLRDAVLTFAEGAGHA